MPGPGVACGPAWQNAFGGAYGKLAVEYDQPYQTGWSMVNNFDMGTQGVAPSAANSQSTAADPGQSGFQGITLSGGTIVYDSSHAAHGQFSILVNQSGIASTNVNWATASNDLFRLTTGQLPSPAITTTLFWRFYFFLTGYPVSGFNFLFRLQQGNQGPGVNSSGTFAAELNTSQAGLTSPTVTPLYQWLRCEGSYQPGVTNGFITYSVYYGDSLNLVWPTLAANRTSGGAAIQGVFFGNPSPASAMPPFWIDDIGISVVGPLGPAGSGVNTTYDAPLTAQVSPAWQTAFRPLIRTQVAGAQAIRTVLPPVVAYPFSAVAEPDLWNGNLIGGRWAGKAVPERYSAAAEDSRWKGKMTTERWFARNGPA